MPDSVPYRTQLYSAVGAVITHYEVDAQSCVLKERRKVSAPDGVMYLWPHSSGRLVYVATSNYFAARAIGRTGTRPQWSHHLAAFRVDPASGELRPHGPPMPLRQRPVHITLDMEGRHALIAYPVPGRVTVHRIHDDGTPGEEVPQQADLDFGVVTHQARFMPSGKTVIFPARGENGSADKPEVPGALKIMDYDRGLLKPRVSIAPRGGYGFGVRHVDFDPLMRWLYVSLERQNELHVFALDGDNVGPQPLFAHSTLGHARRTQRQSVGTVHVHPSGKFVYVANRSSGEVDYNGQKVFAGGENSIAVFAIDQKSGEPSLIQIADTHGLHARCFCIDPTGRMLVAGNMNSMLVRDGDLVRAETAGLSVFRIGRDGKLEFVAKYDVETGSENIWWMGMVSSTSGDAAQDSESR